MQLTELGGEEVKKWWKRSKNKILSVAVLSVLSSVLFVPAFDSHAMTQVGNVPISYSNIFTRIQGSLDETIIHHLSDEKIFALSESNLETNRHYLVLFYNMSKRVNESWLYPPGDDKQKVFSTLNFKYGGEYYSLANNITSFVITGQYSRFGSLEYNADIIINPYSHPTDGYIYLNTVQLEYLVTGEVRTYLLSPDEVPYADQINTIIQSLGNSNGNLVTIIEKVHSIMSDVDSMNNRLAQLYDLLVEVYGQDEADKVVMDKFEQNSSSQSSQLGQLNQENAVDKIDVNNASSIVDSNIDMQAVGDYGVLLSAVTGNGRVGRMILISLSVSLIAYIFFGKR